MMKFLLFLVQKNIWGGENFNPENDPFYHTLMGAKAPILLGGS